MPIIHRPLIGLNNDDKHYEALVKRQMKNDKNHNSPRMYASIPIGSTPTNNGGDISQTNREVNNGQKVSVNNMPLNKKH